MGFVGRKLLSKICTSHKFYKVLAVPTQLFLALGKELKTCFRLTNEHKSKEICFLKDKRLDGCPVVYLLLICAQSGN